MSEKPTLGRGDVHVWFLRAAGGETGDAGRLSLLSGDEADRAGRLRHPPSRDAFIACRAALRTLLSLYGGGEPREHRILTGEHGKPFLDSPAGGDLHFNVSHSRTVGAIALSRGRRVGVDVEHVRDLPAAEGIARRFFAPAERDRLEGLAPRERREAFFRCWTRKEAFLKALGRGLSDPGIEVDVTSPSHPTDREAGSTVVDWPEDGSTWQVQGIAPVPFPGCVAALAGEGRGWTPRTFAFPGGA